MTKKKITHFKLKEALIQYKEKTGKFMTQLEFSELLFTEHNPKTALYHVSMASNGHAFGRFTPEKIVQACEILQCDPNFLFNFNNQKRKNGTTNKK